MHVRHALKVLATTASTACVTAAAVVALAAPAAASRGATPHLDHPSSARCMGWAVSIGAVTGGPRAVAEHHHAVKEDLAQEGLTLGQAARSVASAPSCW